MPEDYRIAAAYIRVSTDDQVELSPASQLVEIRKWAGNNGYLLPDEFVFVDEGISGRKVTGRDAFRRLIGTAKTKPKPFDAILLLSLIHIYIYGSIIWSYDGRPKHFIITGFSIATL